MAVVFSIGAALWIPWGTPQDLTVEFWLPRHYQEWRLEDRNALTLEYQNRKDFGPKVPEVDFWQFRITELQLAFYRFIPSAGGIDVLWVGKTGDKEYPMIASSGWVYPGLFGLLEVTGNPRVEGTTMVIQRQRSGLLVTIAMIILFSISFSVAKAMRWILFGPVQKLAARGTVSK